MGKFIGHTIKIYHECEGRIEKIRREDRRCRVITHGDPEGWIFLSSPHTNNEFFFLLATVFLF